MPSRKGNSVKKQSRAAANRKKKKSSWRETNSLMFAKDKNERYTGSWATACRQGGGY